MLAEWITTVRMRMILLFRRRQIDRDLDDELQFHLSMVEQKLTERGMPPEEARYAARREFGNAALAKEANRKMWTFPLSETLWQDIRYGVRQLRRNPGFSTVAVLTLALGIGANAAIFNVVNAVLFRALPYPDAGRIVDIFRRLCCGDSIPMFVYWEKNNPGFEDLTAYSDQGYAAVNLNGGDRPEAVEARKVSVNYFSLFGGNPIIGRTFTAHEDRPGGPQVAIVSYSLWQTRFGGDPAILGKTVDLGGTPYTVIGVMSPNFEPYPPTEVWLPLQANPNSANAAHTLMVAGRLPPEVTVAQANSWMAVIGKRFVQIRGNQFRGDAKLQVVPMQRNITTDLRPMLLILLAAVGLVLLIACANIANLLLVRGSSRRREFALRSALGASAGRLVRQMLTESFLLALAGGALGLVVGELMLRGLLTLAPANAYSPTSLLATVKGAPSISALDPRMAVLAFVLTAATGILFGVFPALHLSKTNQTTSLKESTGGTGIEPKHGRVRNGLAAAQMAIGFMLLCGAALLIRSFVALSEQTLGFDPHNVLTMAVSLAGSQYSKSSQVDHLASQTVSRIERIPGVESAALASALPLWGGIDMLFNIPGDPPAKGESFTGDVEWRIVSPHYFKALRIPLISGRLLREHEPERTLVVNEAMARKFWPDSDPIGQTIIVGAGLGPEYEEGPATIVGIVGNVRVWTLSQGFAPTMYQVPSEVPDAAMALVSRQWPAAFIIRTKPGVTSMSVDQPAQQLLLKIEGLAPTRIRTMNQVIQDSTGSRRFTLVLMAVFAGIALLLAAIGLYGVISYLAVERTHEFGIRVALGAHRQDVLRLVISQGFKLTLIGIGAGSLGSLALTRFLSSQLFGVKPTDGTAFVAASLILIAVALSASYMPAHRATTADPMVALRHE